MSQAYVLKRIWGIKTSSKSYSKCLLNSQKSRSFIDSPSKFLLYEQGILNSKKLSNFREKNWIEWLKNLDRYNLSPSIWYQITPKQWRRRVCKYHGDSKNQNSIARKSKNEQLLISVDNCLTVLIKKSNKSLRNIFLTHGYFDSRRNLISKGFSKSNKKLRNLNVVLDRAGRSGSTCNRQNSNSFINSKNIFVRYNLLFSLIPDFLERKNMSQWGGEILDPETFIIKKANQDILQNEELLRGGELNQFVRQWKWKSNYLEKRFRKLGDMASLMTFVQDQENTVSLSEKMRGDLNSFRLSFRSNSSLNRVMIDSEHRLPRLQNDQILMYKVISTLLGFKKRFKKAPDLKSPTKYNYYLNDKKKSGEEKMNPPLLNLEDILLPKCRRELRVLNCLCLNVGGRENLTENPHPDGPREIINRNAKIRRFTWSSYRFEDLACMNRFSLSTINGSRFSMLRFRMYPLI